MGNLYNNKNYLVDIPYIFSSFIREYDIRKANINILYKKGVIDIDEYNYYLNLPRFDREYQIGMKIRKDKSIQQVLDEGIIEAKKLLFESNGLEDYDIVSIKNDAVFVLNKDLKYTKFDNIEFVNKNTYTSYIHLNGIEIYYRFDRISGEHIDIKGIGDFKLAYHAKYMLDFIQFILQCVELSDLETAIIGLKTFYNQYVNRELDIGYYRTFDSISTYNIPRSYGEFRYGLSCLDDTLENKMIIDISYNLSIIRELYGYVSNVYFSNNDKRRR